MTYKYKEAVDLISQQLEIMESVPSEEEQNKMNDIEHSILKKTIYAVWAITAIITISILALLYYINYDGRGLWVLAICGGGLFALIVPIVLSECSYDLAQKFSKEYKTIIDKYEHPFCSQENCMQEIINIINRTDILKKECKKSRFAYSINNISITDDRQLVSATLYFYDGFDENSKPKYNTQEIRFI